MFQRERVLWAFWAACGFAAVAGVAPLVLAGPSSRVAGAIIPFAVAAIALAGCALLHGQGRPVATALYFVSGLAVVYAILALIAVPLRLAVVGTCMPTSAHCPPGFETPLTTGESSGLAFAIGMGLVAVLTGFFGLVTLYRQSAAKVEPVTPPVRRIAAVPDRSTAPRAEAPAPLEAHAPPATADPAPQRELAAPEEKLELPANIEPLELAAPEVEPAAPEPAPPAGAPSAKRRRAPKRPSPPDAPLGSA